jgi:hypothetical protein
MSAVGLADFPPAPQIVRNKGQTPTPCNLGRPQNKGPKPKTRDRPQNKGQARNGHPRQRTGSFREPKTRDRPQNKGQARNGHPRQRTGSFRRIRDRLIPDDLQAATRGRLILRTPRLAIIVLPRAMSGSVDEVQLPWYRFAPRIGQDCVQQGVDRLASLERRGCAPPKRTEKASRRLRQRTARIPVIRTPGALHATRRVRPNR